MLKVQPTPIATDAGAPSGGLRGAARGRARTTTGGGGPGGCPPAPCRAGTAAAWPRCSRRPPDRRTCRSPAHPCPRAFRIADRLARSSAAASMAARCRCWALARSKWVLTHPRYQQARTGVAVFPLRPRPALAAGRRCGQIHGVGTLVPAYDGIVVRPRCSRVVRGTRRSGGRRSTRAPARSRSGRAPTRMRMGRIRVEGDDDPTALGAPRTVRPSSAAAGAGVPA